MERIAAYRIGDTWVFEQPPGTIASPVQVELVPGVKLARSGKGQLLLYKEHVPYGQPLAGALALGWAHVVAPDATDTGRSTGEDGAAIQ